MSSIAQLLVSGVMLGGIYAIMSMGLTLIFGVLKIVNFAHGEFLMLAMYIAWAAVSFAGINAYTAIIVVVPALFVFGAIIYVLIVRPAIDKPHLIVAFATMGLSIVMQNLALVSMTADLRDISPLFGGTSLHFGPLYLRSELVIGFVISVALTLVLMFLLKRTYTGMAIRATVQDRDAAMLMGINVPRLFLLTFAGGSALVGLAGCIMLPLYSTFPTVGLNFVLIAYVVVVLGGMGSMEGAFLGGICIGIIQSLSAYYIAPAYGQMFYFIVFLLVMIIRPNGLLGQPGAAMVGNQRVMVALPTGPLAPKAGLRFSITPRRGTLSVIEIAVLSACVAAAAAVTNRYALDIMVRTFLWGGLALAWNIAGGYAGLISFGHAAFFGIGAYASTILLLSYGVPPWIGMFVGAALAACAGAALTLVCARLRGPFFILSTLAAGEVIRIAALNWRSLTGGSEGLEIAPVPSFIDMVFRRQGSYVALVLAYMLGLYALSMWFERTRYGYYLFASRDNEDSAAAIGINPLLMRITAMAISAALTAIGGTLFAQYFLYLDPTSIIAPDISFQFALICALGGLGTASGPVFGALIIVPLSEMLRGFLSGSASGLHLVIYGTIVIVAVLYFPSGISGAMSRLWSPRSRTADSGLAGRAQKPT